MLFSEISNLQDKKVYRNEKLAVVCNKTGTGRKRKSPGNPGLFQLKLLTDYQFVLIMRVNVLSDP